MKTNKNHPYHLVDNSPWPLTGSIGAMILTTGLTIWFAKKDTTLIWLGILIIALTMIQWWRDVIRESTYQGNHTLKVMKSIKMGMTLFIISEVMFFISFFWAFLHSSISPSIEIGMVWPPIGIKTFNPMEVPLLNTTILLTSGLTTTWAHHSIMQGNKTQTSAGLMTTVTLGLCFTMLQSWEYYNSSFTMADSVYGSCFFMLTGFHGAHVIIGTIFLATCLIRNMMNHFSKTHHLGFEMAAWYWHFVDVVWLFVYIIVYWWGS